MSDSYIQEDQLLGKVYDSRLVRRMLPYVLPYLWVTFWSFLLVFAGMFFFLANPYLLGRIIDDGINGLNPDLTMKFAIVYALIEIARFLTGAAQRYLLQYLGQKIMYDLRNDLFSHLMKMPISFFDKNPVGRLVTRTTNDVNTLSELFSSGLVMALGDVLSIAGIAVMLVYLNPLLGAATLGALPLLIASALLFKMKLRNAFRNVRERIARVNAAISENISGMRIIQVFNRENARSEKFDTLNSSYCDAQLESVFYHSFFVPTITVINALTLAVIILYGGSMVLRGQLTMGILVSFIAYAQNFFHPVRSLSEKITIFQSAMASAERLFGLLDEAAEPPVIDPVYLSKVQGEICFDRVCFSYSGVEKDDVIKDVSFTVRPGESVAVVGHTGAGKTTITALLNRFYNVRTGSIKLDGKDISRIERSSLRHSMAVIAQDVFIFAGTVLENIRLWNERIPLERVEEIAKKTGAHEFITKLPAGYNTELAERGANVSAGQRQLIAFTRALAINPSVLILDEATSSIDSETEKTLQDAVETLTRGRTSLIIAHRLSTIRHCSRILVMHNGRLVEQGSHDELLARKGYYYKLYEIQFSNGSES